jgi:hypothetical protein
VERLKASLRGWLSGHYFDLTKCRHFFAGQDTLRERQYEVLRAFFAEGLASAEVARRFGHC